ncbi:MAG: hypothetical protein U9R42_07730 [Bacteroidota bacterium]|nr:hypothetical protein [Bacteroidota bacterium]
MKETTIKIKATLNYKIFNLIPLKVVLSALVGTLIGFLYYKLVGCRSGSCPITSNPYLTMGMGFISGVLLSVDEKKK